MRLINNSMFIKIGTNPNKYVKNFILYLNHYKVGKIFEKDSENNRILDNGIEILNLNSATTFYQNLQAWEALGFIIMNDSEIVKIIPESTESKIYNYIREIILTYHFKEEINIYRSTIVIKLLNKLKIENFIDKYNLTNKKNETLTVYEIEKETGKFENDLLSDRDYSKKIICLEKKVCQD